MGTMLYAKGIFLNRSFDELNVTQPDLVAEVHQALRAGRRRRHRDQHVRRQPDQARRLRPGDQVHAINLQGARIARHAAREQAYVAGAIGPLGIRIEPWGKTGVDEAESYFREQAQALARRRRRPLRARDLPRPERDRRRDPRGAQRLRPADRRADDDRGGRQHASTARRRRSSCPNSKRSGAHVVGLNCSVGPARDARDDRADGRRWRRPSCRRSPTPAGRARSRGATSTSAHPSTWRRTRDASSTTACGWSAAAAARRRITSGRSRRRCARSRPQRRRRQQAGATRRARQRRGASVAPSSPRAEKSRMANELARGAFVVAVELLPPRGFAPSALIEQARQLRIHGVDLVNIPDGPRAGAPHERAVGSPCSCSSRPASRRSCTTPAATATCSACSPTCSARTRWACATCCSITGDPPPRRRLSGRHGGLRRRLDRPDQRGHAAESRPATSAGSAIGAADRFHIGVAVNPVRSTSTRKFRRFDYKVEAGAEFAITQPVFDVAQFDAFLERIERVRHSGPGGDHSAREPAPRRVHGERGARRACSRGGCRADARGGAAGRAAAEGLAIARRSPAVSVRMCRGFRSRPLVVPSRGHSV